MIFSVGITKQIGGAFHGMPWRVQCDYGHISDVKRLTIFSYNHIKIWISEWTKDYGCFGFV